MIPYCGWTNAGLCPKCHKPYIETDEGVRCPFCGWAPIDLAEDCDE